MSSIAFESVAGTVLIGGRERARMGVLINDVGWAVKNRGHDNDTKKLAWVYSGDTEFAEQLGWVCIVGNDAMKLAAHIHGQCEIHGWVHPDDGEWFARQIESAVHAGVLADDGRQHYGTWADLADLARASTTPLVSSYSVCEGWPDPYLIAEHRPDLFDVGPADENDDDYDDRHDNAWSALSIEDRNRIADLAIIECGPRWRPSEWGTHWADHVRPLAQAMWTTPSDAMAS